ncbi:hypothetical protein [Pedobacter miscanthi]|uniref:Uncharacterized protein n=1 Tax=Pedobacter miscanthi TaxID=2259170 RepID=A0A366KND5_9SPHI|nr:hypothetical protein [Pedobacter miscanthi]RBQ02699.1 hypothetical protein DRW42_25480 [Pedobacter miscanthi]
MMINYFKLRDRFNFAQDTFDIGNPISWNRSHFLKHLFKRIFTVHEDHLNEFYHHHLDFYLVNNAIGSEEHFFRNLWELIERQLKVLIGRDIYAENHVRTQKEIEHLKKFTMILISLDQWNIHKFNDSVIARQESEIFALSRQISTLRSDLRKATSLETVQYINIPKGGLLSFLDLCIQMQDIKLPSGREIVFAEFPIVWVKLICKYFRENHEEIDFNRVRRYFPKDRRNPGSRSSAIPSDQHLFEIKGIKKRN